MDRLFEIDIKKDHVPISVQIHKDEIYGIVRDNLSANDNDDAIKFISLLIDYKEDIDFDVKLIKLIIEKYSTFNGEFSEESEKSKAEIIKGLNNLIKVIKS